MYRALLARHGASVVATRANTSYLLAEVAAGALLALDRISLGALARDRGRAERVAAWLYRLGVLWPAVLVRPAIAWAWRLGNRWFVARRATPAGSTPAPVSQSTCASRTPVGVMSIVPNTIGR